MICGIRQLYRPAFVAVVLACVVTGRAAAAEPARRPNILFCLADDWSWPHAGCYGDPVVRTPAFDRVAREGVLFNYCFSAAPSCSPSRAAILTGQYPHRLKEGGNLAGMLPQEFPVYPTLLATAGYHVGLGGKGWGPGNVQAGGYVDNPAGPAYADFAKFLKSVPAGHPFCFWFGSQDPHRPYKAGEGVRLGLKAEAVRVPPMWPDTPEVRNDILDYYACAQRFDRDVGQLLDLLDKAGLRDNTLVVISGDNGWPFPRCKANLYDGGTRQPLAVRWPVAVRGGRTLDDFINQADFAPTFLEAAGVPPPRAMTARSFLGLLTGAEPPGQRNTVFVERERHANVRAGNLGYPSRAIRTRDYLYIRNFHPERWPAGDPQEWRMVGPYGDCDNGPSKQYILKHRDAPAVRQAFQLCFARRPAEELYDVQKDPHQLHNLAGDPAQAPAREQLRAQLDRWMRDTADPRAAGEDERWDKYPFGRAVKAGKK